MNKIILALFLSLIGGSVLAQPGPGPVPDPWIVNGVTIYYPNGGVKVGPNTLVNEGVGTVNVSNGYYVNNVKVNGVASASEPILFNVGTGALSFDYAYAGTFTAAQTINLTGGALPAAQTGTIIRAAGAAGISARFELDGYGTGNSVGVPRFTCVRGDGTGAAPTAVQSGDELCSLNAFAYNGAGTLIGPQASIRTYAAQNWSVGSNGTRIVFGVTPNGSATLTDAFSIENDGGILVTPAVPGGSKGAGTINAAGLYVNGVAVASSGSAITALTGDVVATGPGSVAATIQPNVVTYAKFQQVAASSLVGNPTGSLANAQGVTVGATLAFSGSALQTGAGTGDVAWSANSFVTTLATVNANVGSFGSSTAIPNFTVNGKGLITAAGTSAVIAPAGTLTGTTLASNVVTSSLTSVGTLNGLTVITSFTATGLVTNGDLATMATNTVKGNATSGTASPTDLAVGSCSTAASALIWTTNTGFGCNTSITANAVPAANLTGATLAAGVTGSSLTSVGALGNGSATTGFTINAALVTLSGQFPGSGVAPVANASGSPSATFGVMKADGTTIQCTSGTCSAVGGVATSVQVGVTTVTSGTNNNILTTGTGTLSNVTIASLLTQGNGILITGTTNAGIAVNVASNSQFLAATANAMLDGAGVWGSNATVTTNPGSTATVTITIATPGVVSWTAHGLLQDTPVVFTTSGALPTGITAGTIYYVCSAGNTTNAFEIATTVANADAGTCIATTGSQSGTQTGTAHVLIDLAAGTNFKVQAVSGAPMAIGAPIHGTSTPNKSGYIYVLQPASGSTVAPTFDTGWKFSGGTAPTFTATLSAEDFLAYGCETCGSPATRINGALNANFK